MKLESQNPSPVEYAHDFSRKNDVELWVKRDDLLGGSHGRKVPILLDDAVNSGAKRFLTFGGVGSNFIVTIAKNCQQREISCEGILIDQPKTKWVCENLVLMNTYGANIHYTGSFSQATLKFIELNLKFKQQDGTFPYCIRPGGATVLGATAFSSAAKELVSHIKTGTIPKPKAIFIAASSMGSTAGLVAELSNSIMPIKVHAVQVAESYVCNNFHLKRLINKTLKRLGGKGKETTEYEIVKGYLGKEYGAITKKSQNAVDIAKQDVGITLDTTYSGKAFAAMIDWCSENKKETVLFWNTLSSVNPQVDSSISGFPSGLDERLKKYFVDTY